MATDKEQVNVYLEKSILGKLDEARAEDGLSRSAMVGRLVRRYLRKREERLGAGKGRGQRGGGASGAGE